MSMDYHEGDRGLLHKGPFLFLVIDLKVCRLADPVWFLSVGTYGDIDEEGGPQMKLSGRYTKTQTKLQKCGSKKLYERLN